MKKIILSFNRKLGVRVMHMGVLYSDNRRLLTEASESPRSSLATSVLEECFMPSIVSVKVVCLMF